tara:strand:+ start:293 stop:904 length:612 start_codon:yes stop_codon:yes gene_type:complete
MKIKLCGFNEIEPLKAAIEEKIDYIGLVFHEKSVRNVSLEKAAQLSKIIPKNISCVAVTVDPSLKKIAEIAAAINPEFIQIHGQATIPQLQEVKNTFPYLKIIRALSIENSADQVTQNEEISDHILLDNKNPGSGETFDWGEIKKYNFKKEWFLSGGLNHSNILDAAKQTNAPIIDLSSGIEEEKGKKSIKLIKQITTLIKNI